MSIQIRTATCDDYPMVSRLRYLAAQDAIAKDGDIEPVDPSLAFFDQCLQVASWIRNRDAAVIVASDGPEALGYLVLCTDKTAPYRQEPTTFVDGFYVTPDGRKRNVAGMLYRAAYKLLRRLGYEYAQAVVLVGNEPMHVLMREHGWRVTGILYERKV